MNHVNLKHSKSCFYQNFHSGAEALGAAIIAVGKYGGASAGYRTLLDALIPALTVLKEVTCSQFHLCDGSLVSVSNSTFLL